MIVSGRTFCFTGTFAYGRRKVCEHSIQVAGGKVSKGVNRKLNYLVIGSRLTPAWVHSTHGRKIEAAVAIRDDGYPLHIVSEAHWTRTLLSISG